jgi:hypothetical protein
MELALFCHMTRRYKKVTYHFGRPILAGMKVKRMGRQLRQKDGPLEVFIKSFLLSREQAELEKGPLRLSAQRANINFTADDIERQDPLASSSPYASVVRLKGKRRDQDLLRPEGMGDE